MRRKKERIPLLLLLAALFLVCQEVLPSEVFFRRYRTCSLVRVPSLRCGVVSETDMIHFIKSILSLGRFSPLSLSPFLPSVRLSQVPFDRISQRPKDEGREEDGKKEDRRREGGKEAMDCFAASRTERTDGCKGNQISPRDCLSFPLSLLSLSPLLRSVTCPTDRPSARFDKGLDITGLERRESEGSSPTD